MLLISELVCKGFIRAIHIQSYQYHLLAREISDLAIFKDIELSEIIFHSNSQQLQTANSLNIYLVQSLSCVLVRQDPERLKIFFDTTCLYSIQLVPTKVGTHLSWYQPWLVPSLVGTNLVAILMSISHHYIQYLRSLPNENTRYTLHQVGSV